MDSGFFISLSTKSKTYKNWLFMTQVKVELRALRNISVVQLVFNEMAHILGSAINVPLK